MRKLQLSLDSIEVESFDATPARHGARGTVRGHATNYGTCQGTCVQTCGGPTCDPPCQQDPTMYVTCADSCYWTDGVNACLTC